MEWWGYLIIAIFLIIGLVILFFVSYYFNKKTPIPKECLDLKIDEENCSVCKNYECELRSDSNVNKDVKKEDLNLKEDQ